MRDFENKVRDAIDAGESIDYLVLSIYRGDDLLPRGITIEASETNGFSLGVTILTGTQ
jgi:hypothetical protein